jgi:outer membrane receptor protein involved in Fe transport
LLKNELKDNQMNMRRFFAIASLILITNTGVLAQGPAEGSRRSPGSKGMIEGRVLVRGDGPLEYANVALYRRGDSSLVTGTVTDVDGAFQLKNVPLGKYYMEFNFIGFRKTTMDDVRLTPSGRKKDVGTVYLQEATQEIEGVEVTAERPQVHYKVDKKVINVDRDYTAEGGSAIQVLENVPSIQVDIEGNVELRGSSSFRVLVDGKPSVLEGSDALQQIPASMIDDIEIITNPSAKYDPEGTAGIINVIMKKERDPGLNGMVKGSVGSNNAYDGTVNLNYRVSEKVNVFTTLNYRDFNFDMDGRSNRQNYYPDTTSFLDQRMSNTMERDGYSAKAGMDYHFNESSTLSFSARAGNFSFGRGGSTRIESYTMPASQRSYEISSTHFDISHDYVAFNLDFQNKFNDKGHKLDVSANYSFSDNQNNNSFEEVDATSEWEKLNNDPYRQRTLETSDEGELQVKLDYVLPTSAGKLEAGYQGRYDRRDQDYGMERFLSGSWNQLTNNSVEYSRMIQALYSTFSGKVLGIDYKLGLRGEYTDRLLTQKRLNEEYGIDRFDIFPTAHFSKSFSRGEQVFASYSRRINRPRSWFIDPFQTYRDQYNLRQGNPGLEPEYTDSYEAGYKNTFGKSFVSLEGYYRKTNNEITRIMELGDNNTMIHTFENLDSETNLGFELMFNTSLSKWWNLNVSGNLYRFAIDTRINGEQVEKKSNNWSARANNTFKLPMGLRLQLMAMYRGPSVTAQGSREGFLMTSAAIKQSFLDDKLSLTVSGRDLFQSMNREMTSSGPGFESFEYREHESPIVRFSVSYTINNYKRQKDRSRGEGGDYEGMDQMF